MEENNLNREKVDLKVKNLKIKKNNFRKLLKKGLLILTISASVNAGVSYKKHMDEPIVEGFELIGEKADFYTEYFDWFKKHYDFRVLEASNYNKKAEAKDKKFSETSRNSFAINVDLKSVDNRAKLWLKYQDVKENIKRNPNIRYGVYWDIDELFNNKKLSSIEINNMLKEISEKADLELIHFGVKGTKDNLLKVQEMLDVPVWLVAEKEKIAEEVAELSNVVIISNPNNSYIRSIESLMTRSNLDFNNKENFLDNLVIEVNDESPRDIADKYGWTIEEIETYNKKNIKKGETIEVPSKVKRK